MHFDPDLDDDVRKARERFIENRERQLQSVTTESVDKSLTFLFSANAGSAVAILAYLGAISSKPDVIEFKVALAMFFLGVMLIGIFRVFVTEMYGSLFWAFKKSTENYFEEKQEWEDFYSEINAQVVKNNIPRIFVYSSFACFFLGCIFGVLGLYA
ncbi:hypothetical protein QX776_08865 [Alteromonadaceae bacterium BrNp21-10]|nr:hypothetical protein [Alteromonadaceae bacterium BrNp21-10]